MTQARLPKVLRLRRGQPAGWLLLLGMTGSLPGPVAAQSTSAPLPVVGAASLPAGISERLRREAERPMYWIKVHGEPDKAEARKPAPRSEPIRSDAVARKSPVLAPAPAPVADNVVRAPVPQPKAAPALPLVTDKAPDAVIADAPSAALPLPDPPASEAAAADTPSAVGASTLPAPAAAPTVAALPVVEALELLSSTQPEFPQTLMRRLRKGELQVEVDVSTEGNVVDARVLSSSNPRLDAAAMSAIRTWQFKPPAQTTSAVINFSFDLDS